VATIAKETVAPRAIVERAVAAVRAQGTSTVTHAFGRRHGMSLWLFTAP
jgi:hypothetical protein